MLEMFENWATSVNVCTCVCVCVDIFRAVLQCLVLRCAEIEGADNVIWLNINGYIKALYAQCAGQFKLLSRKVRVEPRGTAPSPRCA